MASVYAYTARNGEGRFVAGSLQAENREQALAHLRTRTLFVTSISAAGSATSVIGSIVTAWPISAAARTAFFRSFATLIRAGVPIRRALDVVVESCRDARLREAFRSVSSDIESGSELSTAMSRRPREFSRLFVAMIREANWVERSTTSLSVWRRSWSAIWQFERRFARRSRIR